MIYAQPGTRGVAGQDPPVPMEKTVGVTQEHPHPSPSKSLGTIKAHRDPSQETPLLGPEPRGNLLGGWRGAAPNTAHASGEGFLRQHS